MFLLTRAEVETAAGWRAANTESWEGVSQATVRKVALVFQEHATVNKFYNGVPAMVSIPLEVIRSLYEEAGLIPAD